MEKRDEPDGYRDENRPPNTITTIVNTAHNKLIVINQIVDQLQNDLFSGTNEIKNNGPDNIAECSIYDRMTEINKLTDEILRKLQTTKERII